MNYILVGFQKQYIDEIVKQIGATYPSHHCRAAIYIPDACLGQGHGKYNNIKLYDRNKLRNFSDISEDKLYHFNYDEYIPYFHYFSSLLDRQISGFVANNVQYRMFISLISLYNRLLDEEKIEFVISREIPHFGSEFVFYLVAKARGIKIVMFDFVEHLNRTLPIYNVFEREIEVQVIGRFDQESTDLINRLSRSFKEVQDSTAAPSFKTFSEKWSFVSWLKYVSRDIYYLIKKNPFSLDLTSLAKYSSQGLTPFKRYQVVKYFSNLRLKSYRIEKYYNSLSSNVKNLDLENSVVFFSHYQPERTTNPDGGPYYDIVYALKKLQSKLPEGTSIIYKEHPHIFSPTYRRVFRGSLLRDEFFYNQLSELGVKFVSPYENNDLLFERCKAIASVTGTVLIEGVAKGKQAIMLGNSWHVNLSSVVQLDKVSKVELDSQVHIDRAVLVEELNKVYAHSTPRIGLLYKDDLTTKSDVSAMLAMLREQNFI